MLLVIDNFDSFTYNLVQYFGELGVEQKVVRNTAISKEEAVALNPERVVVSPGPCTPDDNVRASRTRPLNPDLLPGCRAMVPLHSPGCALVAGL